MAKCILAFCIFVIPLCWTVSADTAKKGPFRDILVRQWSIEASDSDIILSRHFVRAGRILAVKWDAELSKRVVDELRGLDSMKFDIPSGSIFKGYSLTKIHAHRTLSNPHRQSVVGLIVTIDRNKTGDRCNVSYDFYCVSTVVATRHIAPASEQELDILGKEIENALQMAIDGK